MKNKVLILFLLFTRVFSENLEQSLMHKDKQEINQNTEKKDFAQIIMANYQGESTGENFFGIKPHLSNYFFPTSYSSSSSVKTGQKRIESKFQISIKKPLFENLMHFEEKYYFAYTQISWWQFYRNSSPFREHNFAPEFFIDFPFKNLNPLKLLRIGYLHESNGKDDKEGFSRSWNRIYLSSAFLHERFSFVPRIWYRIPEPKKIEDNPDISNYMGFFDLNIAYLGKDFLVNLLARNNLNFRGKNHGAYQFDIGFDLFDNGVFWQIQYFNGYGESLIDYDRYIHKISAGFLIAY